MNFTPTRPLADIAREYIDSFWALYKPAEYLRRCDQQCLNINTQSRRQAMQFPLRKGMRLVAQVLWRQGIRRTGVRVQFWRQLITIVLKKPQVLNLYLGLCAAGEHFWEYRVLARHRISEQLGYDPMSTLPTPNR